jgi:predicted nucleic acid-binding protein
VSETDAPILAPRFLDTSVLVRYLTGEPPAMAQNAHEILEQEADLLVTDLALMEAAYVLGSVYKHPREVIVDGLIQLLQRQNIRVFGLDKGSVINGLLLCRPSNRVSIGDALIWAAVRSVNDGVVYTFDARFPSQGIEVRRSTT